MKYFQFHFLAVFLLIGFLSTSCGDVSSLNNNLTDSSGPSKAGSSPDAIQKPLPKILSFSSSAICVRPGEEVTLSWQTKDAAQVYLKESLVDPLGNLQFTVAQEENINLTAKNEMGTTHQEIPIYLKGSSAVYQLIQKQFSLNRIEEVASSLSDNTLLLLSEGKIYKGSMNQGFMQLPNVGTSQWNTMAIDPFNSSILYAATVGRVYRSTDGGRSWPGVIPVRNLGIDMEVHTVLPSATTPGIIYIGFAGGAYRANLNTTPGTLDLLSNLNGQEVNLLAEVKNHLVAATSSALFVSSDLGAHWNSFSNPFGSKVNVFAGDADHLFAGTDFGLYEVDPISKTSQLLQTTSRPIQDMRMDKTGILYIAAADGFSKYENSSWKKFVSSEVNWILDSSTKEVLTPTGLMQLQENIVYSDVCPNQE